MFGYKVCTEEQGKWDGKCRQFAEGFKCITQRPYLTDSQHFWRTWEDVMWQIENRGEVERHIHLVSKTLGINGDKIFPYSCLVQPPELAVTMADGKCMWLGKVFGTKILFFWWCMLVLLGSPLEVAFQTCYWHSPWWGNLAFLLALLPLPFFFFFRG